MTTPTIGNHKHALDVVDLDKNFTSWTWEMDDELPVQDGEWILIGIGSYRRVYLAPCREVVYKVEIGTYSGYANQTEYDQVQRLKKRRSRKYYIPKAYLFPDVSSRPVLAMEYIEGEYPEVDENYQYVGFNAYAAEKWSQCTDLHERNVKIMPDGRIALLDLGF